MKQEKSPMGRGKKDSLKSPVKQYKESMSKELLNKVTDFKKKEQDKLSSGNELSPLKEDELANSETNIWNAIELCVQGKY
jgi:hypothetical protein